MPHVRDRIATDGKIETSVLIDYDHDLPTGPVHIHDLVVSMTPFRSVPSIFEEIEDVVGSRGMFHPTKHVVMHSSVSGVRSFWNTDLARITVKRFPMSYPVDLTLGGICPLPSSSLLSVWSSEAFNAFHDQIPTEVSVANFLYELRDMKGMIPKIERSISRTASSNFLAFEFGVKPFIGDLQKLMNLSESVNKRLNHLVATAGKEVSLSFKRDIPQGTPIDTTRHIGAPWNPGANIRWKQVGYSGKFQVTGKLTQNLDDLRDPLSTKKAFAAALGLNNPAAIVWEAIPYSFVVDWFFRLDKQIGRLAIQPFGGEWTLRDVGYSVKESFNFLIYQEFYLDVAGNIVELLGTVEFQRYMRFLGLPMSSLFLTDGSLTPKQLALSLALLNQLR
jgi:hypothetical protein